MIVLLPDHPLIMALGWMLVHVLWQAALVGLLIRVLWLFISRSSARWRYGLSLGGMMVILLAAGLTFSVYQERYTPEIPIPLVKVASLPESSATEALTDDLEPALSENYEASAWFPKEEPIPSFTLDQCLPYLVLLWILGALIMSLRLAGSWWYIHRVSRCGLVLPNPIWERRFRKLLQQMKLPARVRIYFSQLVAEPVTFGHIKPIILFPVGLINQLSVDEVESILLHELAHISRWDYLVNWLQSVIELLFFFHPAVWWLSAEVRKAREHCCDDLVLQRGKTSRKLYAQTLTRIAALSFDQPKSKLVMSIQGIKNAFSQRVLRLYGRNPAVLDWRKPVLSLTLGCIFIPFVWMLQPEILDTELSAEDQSSSITFEMENDDIQQDLENEASTYSPDNVLNDFALVSEDLPPPSSFDLADAAFYEMLQLERVQHPTVRDKQLLLDLSLLPQAAGHDADYYLRGPFLEPMIQQEEGPLFVVDGKTIPRDAPYRQIKRDEIAKFTYSAVPWGPEMINKLPPEQKNGMITIETKAGNWPGGRPYWPAQIRDREIKYSDHLSSWVPMGKASGWKDFGGREGFSYLNGKALRKINYNGLETYSLFNGRVLNEGEVLEINQYALLGSQIIPAIGLYDQQDELIYGERTPPEIMDRIIILDLKEGYRAVIGKYPCDNKILLRSRATVSQSMVNYHLRAALHQGFQDVTARKAMRHCQWQMDDVQRNEAAVKEQPAFIVDGQPIPAGAPLQDLPPDQVVHRNLLGIGSEETGSTATGGVITIKTMSGHWRDAVPYWPYELKGKQLNERLQVTYSMVDGEFVKPDEKMVINQHAWARFMQLHVIGVYETGGVLKFGEKTPAGTADQTYEVQLTDRYMAVVPKYPCDARISVNIYTTVQGMPSYANMWRQVEAGTAGITPKMIRKYCDAQPDHPDRWIVHEPVIPEPLFIIDGQIIEPTAGYATTSLDQIRHSDYLPPEAAAARYGPMAKHGAVILQTKAGSWSGQKPYAPLSDIYFSALGKQMVASMDDNGRYLIEGQVVTRADFLRFNQFAFQPSGTIMYPRVGAVHGIDGPAADLTAVRKSVKDSGIAYEVGPGIVAVEYFKDCENTIPLAMLCSRTMGHVPREKDLAQRQALASVPWEKLTARCEDDPEVDHSRVATVTAPSVNTSNTIKEQIAASLTVYPVPVGDVEQIAFTLPEQLDTKVGIFTLEGRLLEVLVNETLEAGSYNYSWDARKYVSGNYMLRLDAGGAVIVRQLNKF